MRATDPPRPTSRDRGVPAPLRRPPGRTGNGAEPRPAQGPGHGSGHGSGHGIPDATVARLPVYLRALQGLADRSVITVSSDELATVAGVNSAKLRKDLSHLGSYGTRGVGYDVQYLMYQIARELGLTQNWPVAIIGVGNLGRALAHYGGFATRGFQVSALIDADRARVGESVGTLVVDHIDDLERVLDERDISIAVVATPAGAAQGVCDRLVAAGVRSILNFAPTVLVVPQGVEVRKVDLGIELQILAFHEQRRLDGRLDGRLEAGQLDGSSEGPAAQRRAGVVGA